MVVYVGPSGIVDGPGESRSCACQRALGHLHPSAAGIGQAGFGVLGPDEGIFFIRVPL